MCRYQERVCVGVIGLCLSLLSGSHAAASCSQLPVDCSTFYIGSTQRQVPSVRIAQTLEYDDILLNLPPLPQFPPAPTLPLPQFPPAPEINIDPGKIFRDAIEQTGNLVGGVIEGLKQIADRTGDTLLRQAAVNATELLRNVEENTKKAVADALASTDKAVADTSRNILKSINDGIDAGRALERFGQREIAGMNDVLANTQRRLSEGKIVDAVWHSMTEKVSGSVDNGLAATEESELIDQGVQWAATAAGGPGGAALYVAVKEYKRTGNLEAMMRAGALAYASSAGLGDISNMPASSVPDAMKKAAMAGTYGAVAVAAAGGNTDQMTQAFLKSGGTVLVQSGQDYVGKNYVDPARKSLMKGGDVYCARASGLSCKEIGDWYQQNSQNLKEIRDRTQRVVTQRPTVKVSKDGQWAVSWQTFKLNNGQERVLAVLTDIGKDTNYRRSIDQIAALTKPAQGRQGDWVAVGDMGVPPKFFTRVRPDRGNARPQQGDILKANKMVNIRLGAGVWKYTARCLKPGQEIRVVAVQRETQRGTRNTQDWVRFAAVPGAGPDSSLSSPCNISERVAENPQ